MPNGSDRRSNPEKGDPFAVDFSVAHPARVQSYLAGGGSHFAADRDAAENMAAPLPSGVDTARGVVRILGAFVRRAMTYLATETDIRQFVSVGVAPPSERRVHDVVWDLAPDARFVYVSDDAVVLAESHALRRGAPDGAVEYVHGTVQDLPKVLARTDTLDLAAPIAVSFVTTLSFVPDQDDPHGIVGETIGMLAPGSHLVVAHPSFDIAAAGMAEAADRLSQVLDVWEVRTRDEIARFFAGLDMVDPGLVPIEEWRPEDDQPHQPGGRPTPIFAGVGRKPALR